MEKRTERFEMRVSPEFMSSIDEWRRHQRDIPARAEAIRRLLVVGLRVDGQIRDNEARITLLGMRLNELKQATEAGGPKYERECSKIQGDIAKRTAALQALMSLSSVAPADDDTEGDE